MKYIKELYLCELLRSHSTNPFTYVKGGVKLLWCQIIIFRLLSMVILIFTHFHLSEFFK